MASAKLNKILPCRQRDTPRCSCRWRSPFGLCCKGNLRDSVSSYLSTVLPRGWCRNMGLVQLHGTWGLARDARMFETGQPVGQASKSPFSGPLFPKWWFSRWFPPPKKKKNNPALRAPLWVPMAYKICREGDRLMGNLVFTNWKWVCLKMGVGQNQIKRERKKKKKRKNKKKIKRRRKNAGFSICFHLTGQPILGTKNLTHTLFWGFLAEAKGTLFRLPSRWDSLPFA